MHWAEWFPLTSDHIEIAVAATQHYMHAYNQHTNAANELKCFTIFCQSNANWVKSKIYSLNACKSSIDMYVVQPCGRKSNNKKGVQTAGALIASNRKCFEIGAWFVRFYNDGLLPDLRDF